MIYNNSTSNCGVQGIPIFETLKGFAKNAKSVDHLAKEIIKFSGRYKAFFNNDGSLRGSLQIYGKTFKEVYSVVCLSLIFPGKSNEKLLREFNNNKRFMEYKEIKPKLDGVDGITGILRSCGILTPTIRGLLIEANQQGNSESSLASTSNDSSCLDLNPINSSSIEQSSNSNYNLSSSPNSAEPVYLTSFSLSSTGQSTYSSYHFKISPNSAEPPFASVDLTTTKSSSGGQSSHSNGHLNSILNITEQPSTDSLNNSEDSGQNLNFGESVSERDKNVFLLAAKNSKSLDSFANEILEKRGHRRYFLKYKDVLIYSISFPEKTPDELFSQISGGFKPDTIRNIFNDFGFGLPMRSALNRIFNHSTKIQEVISQYSSAPVSRSKIFIPLEPFSNRQSSHSDCNLNQNIAEPPFTNSLNNAEDSAQNLNFGESVSERDKNVFLLAAKNSKSLDDFAAGILKKITGRYRKYLQKYYDIVIYSINFPEKTEQDLSLQIKEERHDGFGVDPICRVFNELGLCPSMRFALNRIFKHSAEIQEVISQYSSPPNPNSIYPPSNGQGSNSSSSSNIPEPHLISLNDSIFFNEDEDPELVELGQFAKTSHTIEEFAARLITRARIRATQSQKKIVDFGKMEGIVCLSLIFYGQGTRRIIEELKNRNTLREYKKNTFGISKIRNILMSCGISKKHRRSKLIRSNYKLISNALSIQRESTTINNSQRGDSSRLTPLEDERDAESGKSPSELSLNQNESKEKSLRKRKASDIEEGVIFKKAKKSVLLKAIEVGELPEDPFLTTPRERAEYIEFRKFLIQEATKQDKVVVKYNDALLERSIQISYISTFVSERNMIVRGLFAREVIEKGQVIAPYEGVLLDYEGLCDSNEIIDENRIIELSESSFTIKEDNVLTLSNSETQGLDANGLLGKIVEKLPGRAKIKLYGHYDAPHTLTIAPHECFVDSEITVFGKHAKFPGVQGKKFLMGVAALANSGDPNYSNTIENNSAFMVCVSSGRGFLVATRKIERDSQIIASYEALRKFENPQALLSNLNKDQHGFVE